MRGLKVLFVMVALLLSLGLTPKSEAQVSINIGVPPTCPYGYYEYPPYACAPVGFYGPGYFYNGIFLGVGPWRNWGYGHGWGGHRFVGARGGRYVPGRRYGGRPVYHGRPGGRPGGGGHGRPGGGHGRPGGGHGGHR